MWRSAWSRLPLWLKILLAADLLLVVAVTTTGLATYKAASEALRAEIIAAGKTTASDFATVNALEFLDEVSGKMNLELRLKQLVRTAGEERIASAVLLDRAGAPLAFAGAAAEDIDPAPLTALRAPALLEGRSELFRIAAPVRYDQVHLGSVVFDLSDARIRQAAKTILAQSASIIAVAIVINALVLMVMMRVLMRPVAQLSKAAESFARGDFGQRITATLADDEVGSAARSFNDMADALALHMRFSNAALVERIRSGQGTDEPQEHQLTIAFGDAQGYTHWTQRRDPVEVFSTLTRYFTCIGRITVHELHGIIDKFMGDGVMAHFGLLRSTSASTTTNPADVRNALRAIIYSQVALRVLSHAIRTFEGREPLTYRFGIASGRCMVGAVGARGVMLDYSLIGPVVNLASRLEAKAPAGGLIIDRFTRIDSGPDFLDVVDAGQQQIKGIERPIQLFVARGFAQREEVERMQAFLVERFFDEALLDEVILAGAATPENRAAIRSFLRREIEERPTLPLGAPPG